MILFAVIDILGSVPIIISLRNKVGHIQSEKASLVAVGIMEIEVPVVLDLRPMGSSWSRLEPGPGR